MSGDDILRAFARAAVLVRYHVGRSLRVRRILARRAALKMGAHR